MNQVFRVGDRVRVVRRTRTHTEERIGLEGEVVFYHREFGYRVDDGGGRQPYWHNPDGLELIGNSDTKQDVKGATQMNYAAALDHVTRTLPYTRPDFVGDKTFTIQGVKSETCSEAQAPLRRIREGLQITETTPFTLAEAAPYATPRAVSWGTARLTHAQQKPYFLAQGVLLLAYLHSAESLNSTTRDTAIDWATQAFNALAHDQREEVEGLSIQLYNILPGSMDTLARQAMQRRLDTDQLSALTCTRKHEDFSARFTQALQFILGPGKPRQFQVKLGDIIVLNGKEYVITGDDTDAPTLTFLPYRTPQPGEVWGYNPDKWPGLKGKGFLIAAQPSPGPGTGNGKRSGNGNGNGTALTLTSTPLNSTDQTTALLNGNGVPVLPLLLTTPGTAADPATTEPRPVVERGVDWVFLAENPAAFFTGKAG